MAIGVKRAERPRAQSARAKRLTEAEILAIDPNWPGGDWEAWTVEHAPGDPWDVFAMVPPYKLTLCELVQRQDGSKWWASASTARALYVMEAIDEAKLIEASTLLCHETLIV